MFMACAPQFERHDEHTRSSALRDPMAKASKNHVATRAATAATVGYEHSRAKDLLGRVYEYFISQFASAEGKKGDKRREYGALPVGNVNLAWVQHDASHGAGGGTFGAGVTRGLGVA
jgi:type I restriction-modification system DNA methylase subunit